ncbi:hypothetical protein BDV93DRAFT_606725 [Ceratobasidium sp. AG-I]|nr:hypothetical protein BDV93DRAFT_606725 [Ceratobasidium sp. AG-I]
MPETTNRAQRRRTSVATLPPHSFVAPMPATSFYSPSISYSKAPSESSYYGYEATLYYGRSSVAPLPSPVLGYPYIPHNPTLDELEACNRRIQAVKLRCLAMQKPTTRSANTTHAPASSHSGKDSFHFATNSPTLPGSDAYDGGESSEDELEVNEMNSPKTPSSSPGQSWRASTHGSIAQLPGALFHARHYEPADLSSRAIDPNIGTYRPQSGLPPASNSNDSHPSDDHEFAYATIKQIIYGLNSSVLAFSFPPKLDFITPDPQGTLPRLAYTAQNKSLLEHKQQLESLLDKLDDVQPHGDEGVRRARKEAVDKITRAIDDLSQRQEMAWYNRLYEQGAGNSALPAASTVQLHTNASYLLAYCFILELLTCLDPAAWIPPPWTPILSLERARIGILISHPGAEPHQLSHWVDAYPGARTWFGLWNWIGMGPAPRGGAHL